MQKYRTQIHEMNFRFKNSAKRQKPRDCFRQNATVVLISKNSKSTISILKKMVLFFVKLQILLWIKNKLTEFCWFPSNSFTRFTADGVWNWIFFRFLQKCHICNFLKCGLLMSKQLLWGSKTFVLQPELLLWLLSD